MPSKVKFTEDQLSDLKEKVEEGYSYKTLQKHFGQSYKVLRRIIKENDLKAKMDENVHRMKANLAKNRQKKKAIKRYKQTDKRHGERVRELVENENGLLKDVSELIDRSNDFARSYLEYIGLDEKRKQNSEEVQKRKATQQALKNVSKGKKHPSYRDFTEKEKSYYIDKVRRGWYKWKIFRNMYSKFSLSENKFQELCEEFDETPRKYSFEGENNPMYGKSPSKKAGHGITGHYKKENGNTILFRSSLELEAFWNLDKKDVRFSLCNLKIDYEDEDGKSRTYNPDIVIGRTVYEIKPSALIDTERNVRKKNALTSFCQNNSTHKYGGYLTEFESSLDLKTVIKLKENERIIIQDNQFQRLKNNL